MILRNRHRKGWPKRASVERATLVGALLLSLFLGAPTAAQEPPHSHNWTPGAAPSFAVLITRNGGAEWVERVRRYEIVEVTQSSTYDGDVCTNPGCNFPEGITLDQAVRGISYSDNGFGGEFGYLMNGVFTPSATFSQITHYRCPPNQSGTVTISLTADDPNTILADDPPATASRQFTCWEFLVTPCSSSWVPSPTVEDGLLTMPDSPGSFTATLTPAVDHLGNSMADYHNWFMNTSDEPGWCLNSTQQIYYPDLVLFVPRMDSGFRPPQPFGATYFLINLGETMAGFYAKALVTTIAVDNWDFGTHGAVSVEIGLGTARLEGELNIYVSEFPIDADGNFIADAAPENSGLGGEDEEGGPGSPGDGLTRYEEYRGLQLDGVHHRMDPNGRDVFVYDQSGIYAQGNFTAAAGALSITVHQLEARDINYATGGRAAVNPNHGTHHKVLQHCLWLGQGNLGPTMSWGAAWAVGPPGDPGRTIAIMVDVEQIEDDLNRLKPVGALANHLAAAIRHVITHELGHGIALWHHGNFSGAVGTDDDERRETGDTNCVMRYNFLEIGVASNGLGNDAAEWDALQFGNLFCTSPDNCRSHAHVDDTDPADPVPSPPGI